MQFPHTHTTTRRVTRKKIQKPRELPNIPYAFILSGLFFVLIVVLVITTSPHNPLFLFLFFVAIAGLLESVLRGMKVSLLIASIITAMIEGLLILRVFQMANLINVVLVIAIGVCFISFAKNMN